MEKDGVVNRVIIVPLDQTPDTDRALVVAATWARRAGVTVELVTVSSPGLSEGPDLAYLERRAAIDGVTTSCRVLKSNAPVEETILDAAQGKDALVCLASHARGPMGELLVGSVSEALVRKAGRPVLLVGPEAIAEGLESGDRMVVCLDGSPHAEAILPAALDWATALGLRPTLLDVARDARAAAENTYLRETAERFAADGVDTEWEVALGDDPARAITGFANERKATVIAMTTHARAGLRRFRRGSIALDVAHEAICPVLALHPEESAE